MQMVADEVRQGAIRFKRRWHRVSPHFDERIFSLE
jgi:hypothetical protein